MQTGVRLQSHSVDLKRVPPKSRPTALLPRKHLSTPPPVEEAVRKDSAVHVSLSSDSLFKQPGDHGDPHPPVSRRAGEARASENYRMPIHCSSEELQRRAIAPIAGGAPYDRGYMGDTQVLSTEKSPKTPVAKFLAIAAFKPFLTTRRLCKGGLLRRT